jgi:N-acetylmuramoyl-L-alanine amidase
MRFRMIRGKRRYIWLLVLLAVVVAAILLSNRDLGLLWWWMSPRPPGIIIHHSATPAKVDGRLIGVAALDEMHAKRGFITWYRGRIYHIGYHFVILPDGSVQKGRPVGCRGAHTHGPGRYNDYIGICLVGNFSSNANKDGRQWPGKPTPAQLKSLVGLCKRMMTEYNISPENVKRHRDFNQTECPGDRFPYTWLIAQLRAGSAEGGRAPASSSHARL